MQNVFVLGLTDWQRAELETIPLAESLTFHDLLDEPTLVEADTYDLAGLLERARAQLADFDGTVDAIIAHWDFPTSVLAPSLAAERGIAAPSLTSVLTFEHKYWSRLAQRECVPEVVPGFAAFDPFADDPLAQIDLEFPFWIKPIKSHSSQLGFAIEDRAGFEAAIEEIRAEIGRVGEAFDEALAMVDLPAEVAGIGGNHCLAEQIISGVQAAPEGSMFRGEFIVHGLVDMHREDDGPSFDRLDYPAATVPAAVQERMTAITEELIRHVGFDDGCFNAEFMWDPDTDALWLIEVNTRISQSHSDLFSKVDGASNHEFAIDIALGRRPRPGARQGRFGAAAKCFLTRDRDGVVQAVPTAADIERVREKFPETVFTPAVAVGDRLSALPNQDPYRYVLGEVYLGAADAEALAAAFAEVQRLLPFIVEDRWARPRQV